MWSNPRFRNWVAVARACHLVQQELARQLKPLDLKTPHLDIMVNLVRHPGMSQQDLANKLFVGRSNMTMLLPQMEKRGLVERRPDPEDKRALRLFLTEEGRALAEKAIAVQSAIVDDIMSVTETAGHLIDGFGTRSRAYVQVQNGCDHRCTFCIIPYGRGNSRSVPAGVVVDQIKRLVDKGFNEVVLTGVDLTSWGADLPATPKLGDLVMRILRLVPDLPRLRISSIDSIEVDENLMQAIATEPRLMPHLHLSLQHGDDMILKRMKRRHLRDDAIRFAQEARKLRPDMTFGADIIAGFPTETDAMFENSIKLVTDCDLTWLHVFPYSAREGTPAARMPAVNGTLIKERAAQLRAAGDAQVARHLAAQQGRAHQVLMESPTMGRTEQFTETHFATPQTEGAIISATITGQNAGHLLAV